MSNEPPEPGAPEPESPKDPPTQPIPPQTPPQHPGPTQPPPGYPPPQPPYGQPVPPYGQPGPHGAPPRQPNPYAQPQQPAPTQPVWQGHQAPQQQYPQQHGWPGQPPYGPAPTQKRRGLLIGLLVVLALALVGVAVVAALLLADDSDSGVAVNDISPGDCLVGDGLADADEEITDLERVSCGDDHDAEVFATFELGADQDLDAAGSQCVDEAAGAGRTLEDLAAADLEIRPLVASDSPEAGDKVVCFIRRPDGSSLSGSEFE